MKKYLTLIICILLVNNLLGQEKYPIPVRTADQKHARTLSQFWVVGAGGINFAKTHGVTPYEYGKYLGNLFAPSWGAGNDFNAFVKGTIYNLENFRHISDAPLVVKENQDGSVSIALNEKIMHKYFPEGNPYTSFDEVFEFMKGVNEPIADHMGAIVKAEVKDSLVIYTLKKK
jgi:hypothetical protein